MTLLSRLPGWGTASGSGGMLRKSRIGKAEGEPQMCVSCWLVRPSAKQRECGCVRCDACVRNNTERHMQNCTGGAANCA